MAHPQLLSDIESILARLEAPGRDATSSGDPELAEMSRRLRQSLEALKLSSEETAAALALAESQRRRYVALFDFAPDGYVVTDQKAVIQEANRAACGLLGQEASALMGAPISEFVAEADRARFWKKLGEVSRTGESADWWMTMRRGEERWFTAHISVTAARDGPAGFQAIRWLLHDVSERDLLEKLLRSRNTVLASMASGAELGDVLRTLTESLEDVLPETRCSVLLLEGDRLRHGAAPSLPEFYIQAVDGLAIGPDIGSCGAAAATRKRIVVEDVLEHPNWADYRDLTRRAEVRSCWSEPIISSSGGVLGTFAMYGHAPRCPEASDLRIIEDAAKIAGIAIENARNRQARERLEIQLRQVIDLVPHMIFVKDWDGGFLLLNRAVAEAYGTTVEALTGRGHAEVHSESGELARMLSDDREVMRSGEAKVIPEETFVDSRGTQRVLQTIKIPYTAAGDGVPAVLGVAIDITELNRTQTALERVNAQLESRVAQRTSDLRFVNQHLKREVGERRAAEQALAAVTERLNHVLSWSPTIVYTLALEDDLPTTFVSANVEQLLGFVPERLTYDRAFWREALHSEDLENFLDNDPRRRGEEECSAELRLRRADGTWRWFQDQRRLVRGSSGEALELVGAMVDITPRKELEAQLRRLQDELAHAGRISTAGELSTMIVHQLNQPLTTIVNISRGCQETLRTEGGGDPQLLPQLDRLCRQALGAAQTIRRLRSFVQKRELRIEAHAINEIIDEALLILGPEAQQCDITVERELAPGLPSVEADRIQIEQVFVNLVRNAIDTLREQVGPRWVRISTRAIEGGMVQVQVSDSGPGIGAGEEEQIFQPFFTTKEDGIGLGLAISRTIIEAHGGTLVAGNDGGAGASFRFNLTPAS